ncbi:MAG TPA: phosphoesterase [Thermoanaerobacterales bacterium]|nr:phosphoesterase [Thermoanaerobacterales bacterium]
MNRHNKKKGFISYNVRIYLVIISILILLLSYYNWRMSIMGVILLISLIFYNWETNRRRRIEWENYIESLINTADTASLNAVINLPIGMVILDMDGIIRWYNPYFGRIFETSDPETSSQKKEDMLDISIKEIIPNLDTDLLFKEDLDGEGQEREIGGKVYKIIGRILKNRGRRMDSRYLIALYLLDITQLKELEKEYILDKVVISTIQVDNYTEVMQGTEDANKPLVAAEIEKSLREWAQSLKGILTKFAEDKYILVFQYKFLEKLTKEKFSILDKFREIKAGNKIPITLSIGVGFSGDTLTESGLFSERALDLALGRGGDQAVVKIKDKVSFYGGKSKAVEKRTKVKARVIAHALRELMEGASNILVMSHDIPDMDALGAAVGIIKAGKTVGREAYFIYQDTNPSLKGIVGLLKNDEEYSNALITSDKAARFINCDTLLIVVDTHKPNFVSNPEILDQVNKVVVIDHHRRGEEFIDDPLLIYLEPYASSTCELITEILQYLDDDIKMKEIEATALLAGIIMDTQKFSFKTGVRTFEAASFLRRKGADPTIIHQLFQEEAEAFIYRAEIVKNAEILYDKIAIAVLPPKDINPHLAVAQGANALLHLKNITASFVISEDENGAIISGRSLGDISVQLILEKLGGGGHLTVAGAQLYNVGIQEGLKELKKAIREYMEEGEG